MMSAGMNAKSMYMYHKQYLLIVRTLNIDLIRYKWHLVESLARDVRDVWYLHLHHLWQEN